MVKYRWRKDIDLRLHLVSLVLHHWRSQSKSRHFIAILSIDSVDHRWYIPGKGKLWLEERFAQGTRQEGGGKRTWGRNGEDGFHWGDYSDEKGDIKDGRDVGDDGDGEHGGGDMVDMVMKVISKMVKMMKRMVDWWWWWGWWWWVDGKKDEEEEQLPGAACKWWRGWWWLGWGGWWWRMTEKGSIFSPTILSTCDGYGQFRCGQDPQ